MRARRDPQMPLIRTTESEVEEARPTLSDSEWTDWSAEGAAELRRVGGGMPSGPTDSPVEGDSVINVLWTLLSPEAVLDDMIGYKSTRGVRISSVIIGRLSDLSPVPSGTADNLQKAVIKDTRFTTWSLVWAGPTSKEL